jgi:integrase
MSHISADLEVVPTKETLTLKPSRDLVVTITKDGKALSLFKDDIWDYSATSLLVKKLSFRAKIEKIMAVEGCTSTSKENIDNGIEFLKILTLHWVTAVGGCSVTKLNGDVNAISFLIRYCLDRCIRVRNIFSIPEGIDFLVSRASTDFTTGLFLGKIQRIVDTAAVLSKNMFWEELKPSVEFQNRLKRAIKKFPESNDSIQTFLIPSEIYQSVLKKTIEDLDRFLEHEQTIKYVFSMRALVKDEVLRNGKTLLTNSMEKSPNSNLTYQWGKFLHGNKKISKALLKLSDAGISKNETWGGLVDTLTCWQYQCAILISAFTGMRRSELLAIPLNGLKILNTDNGSIPVVWSTTTKLEANGSPRFTKWVTSSAVEAAFKVAKIITEGALKWTGDSRETDASEQETPLFFSIEYGKQGIPHPLFRFTTASFSGARMNKKIYKEELKISELDVAEISRFMYGDKVPNKISLGKTWPLTFHQFRRSMAVYAAASGLVAYPVLKAQLKHISMLMTVYYADSNSRVINILGNRKDIKALRSEWIDAKASVEADNLYKLLESDQPLAGVAGKKLRLHQAKGDIPKYFENRRSTKQAVKEGKIRYRPTLVGGCISIAPCNKGAGVLASACISCENAVFLPGSKAALEQTRDFYEAQLAEGAPKRARQEYETNIKNIDSFLNVLVETMEVN